MTTPTVNCITNDEEEFPVEYKLLTEWCPVLKDQFDHEARQSTEEHRCSTGSVQIKVDLDCEIFDIVLQYLEHLQAGKPSAEFQLMDPDLVGELQAAAEKLNIPSLVEYCQKLAKKRSERKQFSLEEIKKHDRVEDCWLLIDNKVYDAIDFVSAHPGGDTILQGAGTDATYYMEIYHPNLSHIVKYLKRMYIGDLRDEDRAKLEPSGASEDFAEALRLALSGH